MATTRSLRLVGAAALMLSAPSFIIGLIALYRAEGPTAPDLNVYLTDRSGQSDLMLMIFALTVAVVLFLVGFLTVVGTLDKATRSPAVLTSGLGIAAVPLFVGFLSLHYALIGTLQEGIDPRSQGFRLLVLQAHAVGDWAGWTGIVLMAGGLIVLGFALIREKRAHVGWTAVIIAAIGLFLIPIGFGFAFTLLLPVWELVAAIELARNQPTAVYARDG